MTNHILYYIISLFVNKRTLVVVMHKWYAYEKAPPMDPNDQLSQNNPYEFIMNPQQPVRRNPFGGGFLLKIVLIIGVGGFIAIILYVYAMTTGTASTSNETFINIGQQQAEIKRVATSGTTVARNQNVKNFGSNTALTLTSNQFDLLTFLAKRGVKVENKTLGLKQNPVTDQKLTTARDASLYDEAYTEVLVSELKAYQGSLQAAYSKTESQTEKDLLCGFFGQAAALIAMTAEDPKAATEALKPSTVPGAQAQACGGSNTAPAPAAAPAG